MTGLPDTGSGSSLFHDPPVTLVIALREFDPGVFIA